MYNGSRVFAACSSDRSSDGRAATPKTCDQWITDCRLKTYHEFQFLPSGLHHHFTTPPLRVLHIGAASDGVLLIPTAPN